MLIDWSIDKIDHTNAEAVFIAFPFKLDAANFTLDLNGIPAVPNDDQLDGAAKDWYPVGRWVDVSDGKRGVTVVPLDAPLVHLGGITTGKWDRTLHPEGPTIMSWALNNHWLVNFKAEPERRHPAPLPADHPRGRTSIQHPRRASPPRSRCRRSRCATSRRPARPATASSALIRPRRCSSPPSQARTTAGSRCACRTSSGSNAKAAVTFTDKPAAARGADPIEHPGKALALDGNRLSVDLDPREIRTVLVRFAKAT